MAQNISQEQASPGAPSGTLTRLGLAIFFAMNVMVCTLALWSYEVYDVAGETAASGTLFELLRYATLLCAIPVVLLLGGPLAESCWTNLRQRRPTTDILLLLGVLAAFGYSLLSLWTGGRHIYFEVACMILVAVTLGRWLEATGKMRASQALHSLNKLLRDTARVVRGTSEVEVPLDQIQPGDLLRVLPGERLPADGVITGTPGVVDDQIITGESLPREKLLGESVYGGSLVVGRPMIVRVTAKTQDGTLQRMIRAVEEAAATQCREQRLADKLAVWFVPLVTLIALSTFVAHWNREDFTAGLLAALAVVLIACPCALAIATPMALWAAISTAARQQVLFRHGDALSRLAKVDTICFDKTGTLTQGSMEFVGCCCAKEASPQEVASIARALASSSTHPLSEAILRTFPNTDIPDMTFQHWQSFSGRGVAGTSETGARYYLGSKRFTAEAGLKIPPSLQSRLDELTLSSHSMVYVGWNDRVQGVILFRESLRDEAATAVRALRAQGIDLRIITGDREARATAIQAQLDVPTLGNQLPTEKHATIQSLQQDCRTVAMVGDGINDAPALAAADVGISMGCGADISRDAADVCLLGDDLTRLPWATNLARATIKTVRRNLFWAFAYNSVGIGLAAAGMLNPILAAVAMVGSSLFVIASSLRLTVAFGPQSPPGERAHLAEANAGNRSRHSVLEVEA